jgi:predicted O-methyltransferase YrrM
MKIVKPREIFNRLPKSDELIRLPMPHGHYGDESNLGLTLLEIFILIALAKSVNARKVLEIGTYRGYTSNALALNLPNCKVTTLDISAQCEWYSTAVEYLLIDSKRYRAVATFDLIFIDGDHTPEGFASDIALAQSVRTPHGIIVWHDCDHPLFPHIKAFTETCGAFVVQDTQLAVLEVAP